LKPHDDFPTAYRTGDQKQSHLLSSSPINLPAAPSDRETLIQPRGTLPTHQHGDIDNFYEEIKEQQQQTARILAANKEGDTSNPYLEAEKTLLQGSSTVKPIVDHHEVFDYEYAE
jgi:hypothetical protein